MFEPNKTVKVRLIFHSSSDTPDLVCAYFPAREKEVVDNYWHTTERKAVKEHWVVVNGYWDIKFLKGNKYQIVEYPDRTREYHKYVEIDLEIWQGNDPFWYDWQDFCQKAENTYKKISSRRYLTYKEKFV